MALTIQSIADFLNKLKSQVDTLDSKFTTNISNLTTKITNVQNNSYNGKYTTVKSILDHNRMYAQGEIYESAAIGRPRSYGKGNIYLTESYKNFTEVWVYGASDSDTDMWCTRWHVQQLEIAFNTSYYFPISFGGPGSGNTWFIYGSKQLGTQTHSLSNDTIWYTYTQSCSIIDIYGAK